jgi:hypothetical protein
MPQPREWFGLILGVSTFFGPFALYANEPDLPYVGLWHFHSSGGYKGYIALDGIGGCSYFIQSAVLSIQATCISREIADSGLMIFGTQEGSSSVAPEYGDQLSSPVQPRISSTTVSFHIHEIGPLAMEGKLITAGADENVRFSR